MRLCGTHKSGKVHSVVDRFSVLPNSTSDWLEIDVAQRRIPYLIEGACLPAIKPAELCRMPLFRAIYARVF